MTNRSTEPQQLTRLRQVLNDLVQVRSIDEVKDIRDRAEAIRAYAKKANYGKLIAIQAGAIVLYAERRLGEMLRNLELAKGSPGNQYTGKLNQSHDATGPIRLADHCTRRPAHANTLTERSMPWTEKRNRPT